MDFGKGNGAGSADRNRARTASRTARGMPPLQLPRGSRRLADFLPESMRRGDLAAVCTTGAYNYSMASNYNRIPRPPIVMLRGGESYVAVRRETPDDLIALDD